MVEKALGVEGDDILYVGDHIYTDAALAKINFRYFLCWVSSLSTSVARGGHGCRVSTACPVDRSTLITMIPWRLRATLCHTQALAHALPLAHVLHFLKAPHSAGISRRETAYSPTTAQSIVLARTLLLIHVPHPHLQVAHGAGDPRAGAGDRRAGPRPAAPRRAQGADDQEGADRGRVQPAAPQQTGEEGVRVGDSRLDWVSLDAARLGLDASLAGGDRRRLRRCGGLLWGQLGRAG